MYDFRGKMLGIQGLILILFKKAINKCINEPQREELEGERSHFIEE
jgi:hypothetical protein